MPKNETKDIAFIAVMTALILIFAIVPINIGAVDMAFMPLLAVVVTTQVKGFKLGLLTGFIFGVVSFAMSFTLRSILSPAFMNPLVSIVPRLIIPVTTYYSGKLVEKILSYIRLNAKVADSIKYGISGAIGVCTNTFFVLGMIMLWYYGKAFGSAVIGWALIGTILATNFAIELAITTALCIPISLATSKFIKIKTPHRYDIKGDNLVKDKEVITDFFDKEINDK